MRKKSYKCNRTLPITCLLILALIMTSCASKPAPSAAPSGASSESVQKDSSHNTAQPSIGRSAAGKQSAASPSSNSYNSSYGYSSEEYNANPENRFYDANETPLSTFSIDVDTASYSNIRRYLTSDELPPAEAIRIEEMVNYFRYDYPQPEGNNPFTITMEAGTCPWNEEHKLALIGLQGRELQTENLPPSNLVFLLDVSGSMDEPDKLPLLKQAFKMMVNQLGERDKVSIVVYAGASGLVLDSVSGSQKEKINDAIDSLEAGGSTAGGAGIHLAYKVARKNFMKCGNNRVILATDGDFNVGISSDEELARLIEYEREKGVFLSVLGFGTGNLKDSKMETLADKGNGNYAYIDSGREAKKVLVRELGANLFTIAKDVKLQVEFNPAKVQAYRLIGYENRLLEDEDFDNDEKDAGELGAGHSVTALYEIVPVGVNDKSLNTEGLKYKKVVMSESKDWMTVKLRYKPPKGDTSRLLEKSLSSLKDKDHLDNNLGFAAAVAEFGMLLQDSEFKGDASYHQVLALAKHYKGWDWEGYKQEFIQLVNKAGDMSY